MQVGWDKTREARRGTEDVKHQQVKHQQVKHGPHRRSEALAGAHPNPVHLLSNSQTPSLVHDMVACRLYGYFFFLLLLLGFSFGFNAMHTAPLARPW